MRSTAWPKPGMTRPLLSVSHTNCSTSSLLGACPICNQAHNFKVEEAAAGWSSSFNTVHEDMLRGSRHQGIHLASRAGQGTFFVTSKSQRSTSWLARPCRGPARPFRPAEKEKYGSESALPTCTVNKRVEAIAPTFVPNLYKWRMASCRKSSDHFVWVSVARYWHRSRCKDWAHTALGWVSCKPSSDVHLA